MRTKNMSGNALFGIHLGLAQPGTEASPHPSTTPTIPRRDSYGDCQTTTSLSASAAVPSQLSRPLPGPAPAIASPASPLPATAKVAGQARIPTPTMVKWPCPHLAPEPVATGPPQHQGPRRTLPPQAIATDRPAKRHHNMHTGRQLKTRCASVFRRPHHMHRRPPSSPVHGRG
jgi:hypothetical protein